MKYLCRGYRDFFPLSRTCWGMHTNGYDERVTVRRRKTTALQNLNFYLNPFPLSFNWPLSLLLLLSTSSSSSSVNLGLQSIWKNKSHLLFIKLFLSFPGTHVKSILSTLLCVTVQFQTPQVLIPIWEPRSGIWCQCPRKTLTKNMWWIISGMLVPVSSRLDTKGGTKSTV